MVFTKIIQAGLPLATNGQDVVVYRIIVTAMGGGLLMAMAGVILLAAMDRQVPYTLGTLSGAIVGSLSTMLMPVPRAPISTLPPNEPRILKP